MFTHFYDSLGNVLGFSGGIFIVFSLAYLVFQSTKYSDPLSKEASPFRTRVIDYTQEIHPSVREALREASDHALKLAATLTKERLNPIFSRGVDGFLDDEYSFFSKLAKTFDFFTSKENIEKQTSDKFRHHCLSPSTINPELQNIQSLIVQEYLIFLSQKIDFITVQYDINDAQWLDWRNDLNTLSILVKEHRNDPSFESKAIEIGFKFGLAPSIMAGLHKALLDKMASDALVPLLNTFLEKLVSNWGTNLLPVFGIKAGSAAGTIVVGGKSIVLSNISAGVSTIVGGTLKFVTGPWGITAYVIYTIYSEYGKSEASKTILRGKLLESLERVRVSLVIGKDQFFYSTINSLSNQIIKNASERVNVLQGIDEKYSYQVPVDLYRVLNTDPESITS
ncbi:MAG: hypothetical protein DCE90_18575 [Pseudanabaena sp.]|nr:MAG: hypothetical protein DCE90_18575 [Pseudanabaena sp.]